jgi:hypothetical protein
MAFWMQGCSKPIIAGKVVTCPAVPGYKELKFHLEHFECSYCKKKLANEKYKRQKGKPYVQQPLILDLHCILTNVLLFRYCMGCHLKLFE